MAKEPKFLSFHMNSLMQQSTHGFSLLQASKRALAKSKTGMHSHEFWQLEFILQGKCRLEAGKHKGDVHAGTYVLIPPNQEHIFYYGRQSCHIISIKFTWSKAHTHALQIESIEPNSFVRYIVDLYDAAIDDSGQLPGFSTAILAFILNIFCDESLTQKTESTLVQSVDDIIHRQQGQALTVQDIAKQLHYTVNHLSAQYARDAGITIKHKIDSTRCEHAKQLLRFEDDSISQIADLLGFVDVFSFSRFFHRMSGMRPKDFRKSKI